MLRLGVGCGQWESDDLTAPESVIGHVVLIPQRPCRRDNTDVELLAEVVPVPHLRSEVPHSGIVKGEHDCCPRLRVHLNGVPAHRVKKVVTLPALWCPLSWSHPSWEEGVAVQVI
eukprot:296987_1